MGFGGNLKGEIKLYRTISRKRDCGLLSLSMKSFGDLKNRLGHSGGSDLVDKRESKQRF